MRTPRWIAGPLAAVLAFSTPLPSRAVDDYPNHTVKIIVGYPPAGTTDIVARLIAQKLSAQMGQAVIVENRPGAGGNIGAEAVAHAAPDGYTLELGTAGNMTINPSIYRDMHFDTQKDFAPISNIAAVPNVMVVNPAVPARTVQEFIAWAKARPGQVFFASSGIGNSPHLTGELFNIATGLQLQHVPYKGSGQALSDLIGGQGVQVMFDNLPSSMPHIKSGALRALAVTGPARVGSLPNVPTMKEAGLADFQVEAWFGLFAPAKTPPAVIARLNKEVAIALQTADMRQRLDENGAQPAGNTPAEFAQLVESDSKRWASVVKVAKIPVQ